MGLLISLTVLVPLELFVESGISSNKRCKTQKINSTGVCASPWKGHSDASIASAALLTQHFGWLEADWDVVLVGSRKVPVASESAFDTVAFDADLAPQNSSVFRLGDVTYDRATSLAFLFWDGGEKQLDGREGRGILAHGVEAVLNRSEQHRLLMYPTLIPGDPWTVRAMAENARRYIVYCETDGLLSVDLVRAVSLYRTTQMEKPGMQRDGVNGRIEKIPAFNRSDATKALFAMKIADWSASCEGEVDVYLECGVFLAAYVVPFFATAGLLAVIWVTVSVALTRVDIKVPHDVYAWRKQAHGLIWARAHPGTSAQRNASVARLNDSSVFEPGLFDLRMHIELHRRDMVHRTQAHAIGGFDEYEDIKRALSRLLAAIGLRKCKLETRMLEPVRI
eukprot:IDg12508t1